MKYQLHPCEYRYQTNMWNTLNLHTVNLPIDQSWNIHWPISLLWRHNGHDGISNHQPHDCLLNLHSGTDQRKHQSSASLAVGWGIHRWRVNSSHKWPVTWHMFPFDDVIMWSSIPAELSHTMAADDLAPCFTMLSAAMVLTVLGISVFVNHKDVFQLYRPQCQNMIWNKIFHKMAYKGVGLWELRYITCILRLFS